MWDKRCRNKTPLLFFVPPPPPPPPKMVPFMKKCGKIFCSRAGRKWKWRMLIACETFRATNTYSVYVLIVFVLQRWLHERCTTLHVLFFLVSADELGLSKKKLRSAKFVHCMKLETFMIRVIKCSWVTSRASSHISYPTFRRSVLSLITPVTAA